MKLSLFASGLLALAACSSRGPRPTIEAPIEDQALHSAAPREIAQAQPIPDGGISPRGDAGVGRDAGIGGGVGDAGVGGGDGGVPRPGTGSGSGSGSAAPVAPKPPATR